MTTADPDGLRQRLAQHPPDRYPAQHATTQFHLGTMLLQSGQTEPAMTALSVAQEVFGRIGMQLEQAKATVMLGVALRTAGRGDTAEHVFEAAVGALSALGQDAEQAAASYNLALVRQDRGRLPEAGEAFVRACELFLTAGYPGQASAAARDHGAALLAAGDAPAAIPLLEQAVRLAESAGDLTAIGAAANVLGLARLADGRSGPAAEALRAAVGAFPRSVRPAEHAMAKANLALAYADAELPARARLAAVQALAVPQADPPVRAQARALLARLPGDVVQDLQTVLDDSSQEQWVGALREEVLRAVELATPQRDTVLRGIVDGVLSRPAVTYDLAESLLHVVVELPPASYAQVVASLVTATTGRPAQEADRVRAVFGSAMARFAMPQWQRLAAALNAAAQTAGQPQVWR